MRDRDRQRENRRVFAGGAVVAAAVVAWLVLGALRRPDEPGVPFVAATATAVVSDQAKAEAAALLDAAVLSFAEGHLGTALELSEQALGKWPQYEAAQRFAATAVPQATAVEQSAQARATAAAQAVLARAQAGEAARRVYGARAGLLLQRYTDALGVFRERHRQARERPELLRDAEWRGRAGRPWSPCRAPPPSSPRWGRCPRTWPPRRRSSPSSPARRRSWSRTTPAGSPAPTRRAPLSPPPGWTAPATCSTKPTLERRRAVPAAPPTPAVPERRRRPAPVRRSSPG